MTALRGNLSTIVNLSFLYLILGGCASQSTSIQISIPQGKETLHLEQELFQNHFPMGAFNFNLKNPELIRYAYLSIDTTDVDHPENPFFLNGHPIGFLSRAGYGPNQNQWYAGQSGYKERERQSRTQRYLPASYFKPGKNTITFSHQKVRRASQGGQIIYEQYTIEKIDLAVIKVRTSQHSPLPLPGGKDDRHFPRQFQFFEELNDEELYVAFVKLPYLLSEISDLRSLTGSTLGYVYARIGDYYRWTGLYNKSLDYHRKASRMQELQPLSLLTPKVQAGLALAYNFVGDYHSSVAECEKALEKIQKLRDSLEAPIRKPVSSKTDSLESLLNAYLSINYYHLNDESEARYYAYHVINNFVDDWAHYSNRRTEIGKYVPIALAYQTMGDVALRKKDCEDALRYYGEAEKNLGYEIRPEIYHDQMINIQIGIAKALYHKGKHRKSREVLQKVSSPTKAFLWRAYLLQGMIAESQNTLEQAIEFYQKAIDEIEFSRARLTSHGLKINFMSDKQEPYARMVKCLIELNRETEAFNYVEKSKARAFLDMISKSEKLIGQKNEVLKEITAEEKRLREKLLNLQQQADMNRELFHERGNGADTRQKIANARGALGEFFSRWFRRNKDFASLRSADTLKIEKVQAMLPAETTLVEYYYRDKYLYAWILEQDSSRLVKKNVDENELKKLVRKYRDLVNQPDTVRGLMITEQSTSAKTSSQSQFRDINNQLETLLVSDIIDTIPSKKVYIVPHGILHYLPFQALSTDGRYLIERYQIGYSPSASVLKHIFEKNKTIKKAVLALGNPDLGAPRMALPYAEVEVQDIKKFFNQTNILTLKQASEAAFKRNAGNYDILHIASHGEFNQKTPLISCLRLAPGDNEDGRLETAEIFELDLNAYLVTLSACNTAMGKIAIGDELMGLTRAFLFAGTPSIMSTLWSVNDQSTRLLMKYFYSNLRTMDKFESMRQAQIKMIHNSENQHPYFWAAFQIIGDYR